MSVIPSIATDVTVPPGDGMTARMGTGRLVSNGAGGYTVARVGVPAGSLVVSGGGYVITLADYTGTGVFVMTSSDRVIIV